MAQTQEARITVRVNPDLHRAMKRILIDRRGVTIENCVDEAFTLWLKAQQKGAK